MNSPHTNSAENPPRSSLGKVRTKENQGSSNNIDGHTREVVHHAIDLYDPRLNYHSLRIMFRGELVYCRIKK